MPDDTTTDTPVPQDNIIDNDNTPAPDGGTPAPANDPAPTPEPADDFSISDSDADDAPALDDKKDGEQQDEDKKPEEEESQEPYEVELPEDFETTDQFRGIINAEGKAAGIDAKTFGKAVVGVITKLREADTAEQKAAGAKLRTDWGSEYQERMKGTKQFAATLVKRGILPRDLADLLQSPAGFRILDAWKRSGQEDGFQRGSTQARSWGSPSEEAHAMVTNPDHPDYEALDNRDHPRHEAARHKYERLCGVRR